MTKTVKDEITPPLDQARRNLLRLVKEHGMDLSEVSKKIGRNHAYLQQYVKYGVPQKLPEKVRIELARVFQVDPDIFKDKKLRDMEQNLLMNKPDSSTLKFDELDLKGVTGNSLSLSEESHAIAGFWSLPGSLVKEKIATPESIRILQVTGDSMQPELYPGDRVMVNLADRTPSPPGLFVIWDGMGFVVKRCMFAPQSSPQKIRLMSANKLYPDYELTLKESRIQGRVIGKWQWT